MKVFCEILNVRKFREVTDLKMDSDPDFRGAIKKNHAGLYLELLP